MSDKARVLFLDVETQPDLVWAWGVYEENAIEIKEHWQLLSFSAEWWKGKAITRALCDYSGYKPGCDDKKLAKELWSLLDEADIVIAHNAVNFDIKKINARFIAHGMTPPSDYKVIDTKREVKKVAAFSSNKLDWLSNQLDIGRKIVHEGWPLWYGCMTGNKDAWKRMKKYNRHDVVLLKKLYKLLSPWIKQPNFTTDARCTNPICGSSNVERRGTGRNKTRTYQRYQCQRCGTWFRDIKTQPAAKVVPV